MNGRRMLVSATVVVGMLVAMAIAVSGSTAAGPDAQLSGKFLATVKTVKSSFPEDKTPVDRNYEFECLNKACTKAQFTREAGDGIFESKLTERKPGVYKGNEKDVDSQCPDTDATGKRKTAHTVKVAKVSKAGKALKLTGGAKYAWPGCTGEPSKTTRFTAVRK